MHGLLLLTWWICSQTGCRLLGRVEWCFSVHSVGLCRIIENNNSISARWLDCHAWKLQKTRQRYSNNVHFSSKTIGVCLLVRRASYRKMIQNVNTTRTSGEDGGNKEWKTGNQGCTYGGFIVFVVWSNKTTHMEKTLAPYELVVRIFCMNCPSKSFERWQIEPWKSQKMQNYIVTLSIWWWFNWNDFNCDWITDQSKSDCCMRRLTLWNCTRALRARLCLGQSVWCENYQWNKRWKTEWISIFLSSPSLPLSEQTKDGSRWVIFSSRGVTGVQIGSSMTKRLILTESLRLKEEAFANASLPGSCDCKRRNTLQLCAGAHGPPVTPTRHMCLQHSADPGSAHSPRDSGIDTRVLGH